MRSATQPRRSAVSRRARLFSAPRQRDELGPGPGPNPTAAYLAPLLAVVATGMLTGAFHRGFDRAYALMQECRCPALPVLDPSDRLVGLFTPENVGEM